VRKENGRVFTVFARDAAKQENNWAVSFAPLALSKGSNGGGCAFFITASWVISWFIKIDLKNIYCNYSCNKKIQNVFYYF